jgi:DNA-binding response OmpR family regulator
VRRSGEHDDAHPGSPPCSPRSRTISGRRSLPSSARFRACARCGGSFRTTRAKICCALSRREFDLLLYLGEHAGKVVTHQQALTHVWGPGHADYIEYLRVYVRQLRQKIESDPQHPKLILTVPGVGYRLNATDAGRD